MCEISGTSVLLGAEFHSRNSNSDGDLKCYLLSSKSAIMVPLIGHECSISARGWRRNEGKKFGPSGTDPTQTGLFTVNAY